MGHANASTHAVHGEARVRLNEANIRRIEPPAKGYKLIHDSDTRGLMLRVTASNVRSFVFQYSVEGQQRRLTIGRWGPSEWTATAARARAQELRQQTDQGEDPLGARHERRAAPDVSEVVERYISEQAAQKGKWGVAESQYLRRELVPAYGSMKVMDLKRHHIAALVRAKAKTKPIAANRLLGVLRVLFAWAVDEYDDLGLENPCARVKPPAPSSERERWLSLDEIQQLWEKLDTAGMDPGCKTALRVILVTGARPGEVIGAEGAEFDLTAKIWRIPAARSKSKKPHLVPLNRVVLDLLNDLERDSRFLFPSPYKSDAPITVAALSNAVKWNQKHFGIPRWTPHDLRRTCATQLEMTCGVPRFVVGQVLGHSDRSVTSKYARHDYQPEVRKALESWGRKLRSVLSGKPAGKVVPIA